MRPVLGHGDAEVLQRQQHPRLYEFVVDDVHRRRRLVGGVVVVCVRLDARRHAVEADGRVQGVVAVRAGVVGGGVARGEVGGCVAIGGCAWYFLGVFGCGGVGVGVGVGAGFESAGVLFGREEGVPCAASTGTLTRTPLFPTLLIKITVMVDHIPHRPIMVQQLQHLPRRFHRHIIHRPKPARKRRDEKGRVACELALKDIKAHRTRVRNHIRGLPPSSVVPDLRRQHVALQPGEDALLVRVRAPVGPQVVRHAPDHAVEAEVPPQRADVCAGEIAVGEREGGGGGGAVVVQRVEVVVDVSAGEDRFGGGGGGAAGGGGDIGGTGAATTALEVADGHEANCFSVAAALDTRRHRIKHLVVADVRVPAKELDRRVPLLGADGVVQQLKLCRAETGMADDNN